MLRRNTADTIQADDVNLALKPQFHIYKSGSTVYATKHDATTTYSGTDAGAALQAAIDGCGAAGGLIVFSQDSYTWTTTPKLPVNLTGWLRIHGNGATATLGGTATSRFLDFDGTSVVNDTFQLIEVDGFTVDAAALSAVQATAGSHNLLGNYGLSGGLRRNYKDIRLTDLHFKNVPHGNNTREFLPIYFHVAQDATAQVNRVDRFLVERVRIDGGIQGVVVVGSTSGGYVGAIDVTMDEITFRDIRHDLLIDGTTFAFSSHVQIGSGALVETCTVEEVWGKGSRDVGIEIDNAYNARVRNAYIENCHGYAVVLTNFRTIPDLKRQISIVENVHCTRTGGLAENYASGFMGLLNNGFAYGAIRSTGCSFFRDTTAASHDVDFIDGELARASGDFVAFELIDCSYVARDCNNAGASAVYPSVVHIYDLTGTGKKKVYCSGLDIRVHGADTSTGTTEWYAVRVSHGDIDLTLRDVYVDFEYTAISGGAVRGVQIGTGGASTTTLRGTLDNVRLGGTPTLNSGVSIQGTANLTLDPAIRIVDSDFRMPLASSVIFGDAGGTGNNTTTKTIRRDNFTQ